MELNNFLYADTDSLKIVNLRQHHVRKIIKVHDKNIGEWKFEGFASKGRFLRAKTYAMQIEQWFPKRKSEFHVTCAGMPDTVKEKVNFDNFIYGSQFTENYFKQRFQGGVLLKDTEFTIKV